MLENISFITVGRITRPHGIRGEVCAQYYAESFSYLDNGQTLIKTEKSAPKPFSVSSWRMQGNILILKLKGVNTRTDAEFLRNYDIVIDENLLVYNAPQKKISEGKILDREIPNQNNEQSSDSTHHNNSEDNDIEDDYIEDDDNVEYDAPFLQHILGAKAIIQKKIDSTEQVSANQSPTGTASTEHVSTNQSSKDQSFDMPTEEELGVIQEITFPAGQELWTIINSKGQEILFPAVSHFIDYYDLPNNKVYINPPEGLIDLYLNETQAPSKEPREMKKRQNAHKEKPLCGEGKKQSKPKNQIQIDSQSKNQNQSKNANQQKKRPESN